MQVNNFVPLLQRRLFGRGSLVLTIASERPYHRLPAQPRLTHHQPNLKVDPETIRVHTHRLANNLREYGVQGYRDLSRRAHRGHERSDPVIADGFPRSSVVSERRAR